MPAGSLAADICACSGDAATTLARPRSRRRRSIMDILTSDSVRGETTECATGSGLSHDACIRSNDAVAWERWAGRPCEGAPDHDKQTGGNGRLETARRIDRGDAVMDLFMHRGDARARR